MTKIQATIDTAIAALSPAEVVDLTAQGTKSDTFARLSQASDPYWPQAMVAQLRS